MLAPANPRQPLMLWERSRRSIAPARQDVSRIEQLLVPQMADRATVAVRLEHPQAKAFLMKSPLRDLGDVLPSPLARQRSAVRDLLEGDIVLSTATLNDKDPGLSPATPPCRSRSEESGGPIAKGAVEWLGEDAWLPNQQPGV